MRDRAAVFLSSAALLVASVLTGTRAGFRLRCVSVIAGFARLASGRLCLMALQRRAPIRTLGRVGMM